MECISESTVCETVGSPGFCRCFLRSRGAFFRHPFDSVLWAGISPWVMRWTAAVEAPCALAIWLRLMPRRRSSRICQAEQASSTTFSSLKTGTRSRNSRITARTHARSCFEVIIGARSVTTGRLSPSQWPSVRKILDSPKLALQAPYPGLSPIASKVWNCGVSGSLCTIEVCTFLNPAFSSIDSSSASPKPSHSSA